MGKGNNIYNTGILYKAAAGNFVALGIIVFRQ